MRLVLLRSPLLAHKSFDWPAFTAGYVALHLWRFHFRSPAFSEPFSVRPEAFKKAPAHGPTPRNSGFYVAKADVFFR